MKFLSTNLIRPSFQRIVAYSELALVNRFSVLSQSNDYSTRSYSMDTLGTPKRWDWARDSSSSKFLPQWCRGTTYSRPLCCGEELGQTVKTLVPGHSDMLISFSLKSKTPITLQVLRTALISLRWRHPDIASIVLQSPPHASGKHVLTYSTPTEPADLTSWLDNVIIHHAPVEFQSLETAIADLRIRYGRTATVTRPSHSLIVHFIPAINPDESCGFLLNIAHEFTDGIGACQIVDELCWELAAAVSQDSPPPFMFEGQEIARLSKPFAGRTVIPWSDMSEEDETHVKFLASNLASKSTFGLTFDKAETPDTTLNTVRYFTPDTTKKFVAVARAKGTKFASLFTAVVTLAVFRSDPSQAIDNTGRTHFTLFPFPVNLRKSSTGEMSSDRANRQLASAMGSALLSVDVDLKASDSDYLDLIVAQVDECMKLQQVPLKRFTSWWDHFSESVLQPIAKARVSLPVPPPPNNFPKISSLGMMDEFITGNYDSIVDISQVLMGVRWTLPNAPVVTPQTYKQELAVNFTWPDCVYSREKVENFADVTAGLIKRVAEGLQ